MGTRLNDNIFETKQIDKPKYNKTLIEDIRNAIDIVSLLENEYGLVLEEVGKGWFRTNCPLPGHRDSDPSFGVNPETGKFSCFGCQNKGDVFCLIQKIDGISFAEAVRRLQIISGISESPDENDALRAIREIQLLTDEYLNRHAEYDLPGGMNPVLFMVSLSNRLRKHESKVNNDSDELEWIDSVYRQVDELELKENYKELTKVWNNLGKQINERYGNWQSVCQASIN